MSSYVIDTAGMLEPHLQREWLLTNGIGGYASSTVVGCNTRKYHGLLVAATLPPVGRVMTLSRVHEILAIEGEATQHEFSVVQFPTAFHPQGWQYLQRFELSDDRIATWTYDVSGVRIVKQVQLAWGSNVVGVRYAVQAPAGKRATLRLMPFAALRDFHATRRREGAGIVVESHGDHVTVREHQHQVRVQAQGPAQFQRSDDWWFEHHYAIEQERGQDHLEDLFTPGAFVVRCDGDAAAETVVTLWAGVEGEPQRDWDEVAAQRRANQWKVDESATITQRRLVRAAQDFVVARQTPEGQPGSTVIAGYPWFADWGRDTMIALPGLLLTTKRFEQAKQVLGVFARYVDQGMIPNRFDDYTSEPSYNTVDASLWFVQACSEYRKASGDEETFERVLKPACEAILAGYEHGTRYGIRMDPADGLITQGDQDTQLTWMDAKCNGVAFTPRQGKAVEINALWYNALMLMGHGDLAARVKESFTRAFWISPFRGLADVVHDDRRDQQVRPNQVFAVSLPHSPLSREQQLAVLEVVRRELLTPVGLRSLAPSDPNFCPLYTGQQMDRDRAYHNGTVWSWLIGPFLSGYLRAHDETEEAKAQVRQWLAPLIDHMNNDACIGQISECFEAQPPHRPVACFAQAWSVAEVLRVAAMVGM